MTHLQRVVSAAVIAVVNLASILLGFAAYSLFENAPQLLVQIPVGFALGLAGVVVWLVLSRRHHAPLPNTDYMIVFWLAFPLGAVFFACAHYVATGYVTSLGNVGGVWIMQFAENVVALPAAAAILRQSFRRRRGPPRGRNDLISSSSCTMRRPWASLIMFLPLIGACDERRVADAAEDRVPEAVVRLGVNSDTDGFEPPQLASVVHPVIPPEALKGGPTGPVVLKVRVEETGEVSVLGVVQGYPLLNDLAEEAVRRWKYEPATLEGEPVAAPLTVVVNFQRD